MRHNREVRLADIWNPSMWGWGGARRSWVRSQLRLHSRNMISWFFFPSKFRELGNVFVGFVLMLSCGIPYLYSRIISCWLLVRWEVSKLLCTPFVSFPSLVVSFAGQKLSCGCNPISACVPLGLWATAVRYEIVAYFSSIISFTMVDVCEWPR